MRVSLNCELQVFPTFSVNRFANIHVHVYSPIWHEVSYSCTIWPDLPKMQLQSKLSYGITITKTPYNYFKLMSYYQLNLLSSISIPRSLPFLALVGIRMMVEGDRIIDYTTFRYGLGIYYSVTITYVGTQSRNGTLR